MNTRSQVDLWIKKVSFRYTVIRFLFLVIVCGWSIPELCPVAQAEQWAQWRGPDSNGVALEQNASTQWSATDGIRWKTPLPGSGISSPIIWNNRVFVTASDGVALNELHIICLSRQDGKLLWHRRLWGTAPTRYHGTKSSMASPTPITDGQHLYTFFGTGDVFCVDLNGNLVWQRSLASEYGKFENRFSATSSPILFKDLLVVQCDHYGNSYLVALNKKTGVNVWRNERPDSWLSWSSPRLAPVSGSPAVELILCGSLRVEGLDPATGKPLWTVSGMRHECIPTPVFGHGLIYAVSGPKGPTLAIRPGGRGDVTQSHVKWENRRGAPFVPSAILVGDYYYLIDDQGITSCLHAATGKRAWQKRLPGGYTASPVATRDHIYFANEGGKVTVIRAHTPRYQQVARNDIGEPIFASPSLASGDLFVRTPRHLWCIGGQTN